MAGGGGNRRVCHCSTSQPPSASRTLFLLPGRVPIAALVRLPLLPPTQVKFHEFVKEHLGEWPGMLVESETGRVIGAHQGYWFYTVGQRSGIKLPGGPW